MNKSDSKSRQDEVLEVLKLNGSVTGIHALTMSIFNTKNPNFEELSECFQEIKKLNKQGIIEIIKNKKSIRIKIKPKTPKPKMHLVTVAVAVAGCTSTQELPYKYQSEPVPIIQVAQYNGKKQNNNYWSYCRGDECLMPTPKTYKVDVPAPRKTIQKKVADLLSADILFASDEYEIKQNGREALSKFVSKIKHQKIKDIQVIGYTDRLASENYNLRLSIKRADAVKKFILSDLPMAKIEAIGRGETNSLTGSSCDKVWPKKKLRACLQPDRRVEINVIYEEEEA